MRAQNAFRGTLRGGQSRSSLSCRGLGGAPQVRTTRAPMGLRLNDSDDCRMRFAPTRLYLNGADTPPVPKPRAVFKTVVGGEEPPGCVRFARASAIALDLRERTPVRSRSRVLRCCRLSVPG